MLLMPVNANYSRNTFLNINYQMVKNKRFVHVNIIHVFNFSITCDMIPMQYLILSLKRALFPSTVASDWSKNSDIRRIEIS